MSWDVMILKFAPEWSNAEAIPSDWQPDPLAPRATIVAALHRTFPGASEDDEGTFRIEEDSTEIWVGDEDPTDSVNVTLWSGSASTTIGRVVAFAGLLGTRALDTQTGEFLTDEGGAESYAEWDRYRSRILGSDLDPADD